MSQDNSAASQVPDKPSKPSTDLPGYTHPTWRWAKQIRGQTRFFGPWDDPARSPDDCPERRKPLRSWSLQ
jgi:hypothetical protein